MSIPYYNEHGENYIDTTGHLDMSHLYKRFLCHIKDGGRILDVGCGSGRDSIYFQKAGYQVTAFDGSITMVEHARKILGKDVSLCTFEDFETDQKFDGIWAVASLLHVPRNDIDQIIKKFVGFLNHSGIFLMSFKERDEDFKAEGRRFTCFNEPSMRKILALDEIEILEIFHSVDIRPGRDKEGWITGIVKKTM